MYGAAVCIVEKRLVINWYFSTSVVSKDLRPNVKAARTRDVNANGKKKTKADNHHRVYTHCERFVLLANTNDSKSLSSDVVYVGKTLYLVFNGLKTKDKD